MTSPASKAAAGALADALAAHGAGDLDTAERLYRQVLRSRPDEFAALHMLGVLAHQRGNSDRALALIGRALAVNPLAAEAHLNRGVILTAMSRHAEALTSWDTALAIMPGDADALYDRGSALQALGRHGDALDSFARAAVLYDKAASSGVKRGNALFMCGNVLRSLRRPDEALASYDTALALTPGSVEILTNRGSALRDLHRHAAALADFDRALALQPGHPGIQFNRANALFDLGRPQDALAAYTAALAARPDYAEALANRGNVWLAVGEPGRAAADFARLLALSPDYPHVAGMLLQARMQACDWRTRDDDVARVVRGIRAGARVTAPFILVGAWDDLSDHRRVAELWIGDRAPASPAPLSRGEPYAHERIKVGYVSNDFYDHATAFLIAGLLEAHDRTRFEIAAVSYGPDRPDAMRTRIRNAVEHFIDVNAMGDHAAASLLRDREIDILVDLKGFTEGCRTGILAHKPAPIQVNWLGYPGTMGAPYIDYILADRFVIPPDQRSAYSEKIVLLPDSYQPNDSRRRIADRAPTRAACDLPDGAFVFCAFGNSWKISPATFDVWMRLLRHVEGSVLWLLRPAAAAEENLRREAAARGVDPDRLVFAPRVGLADHLARHRLADFYLDTLPYNAHTSASDALWAGLPVLTCAAGGFAGRVGESLLNAVGLPELLTRSLEDYEALALHLARAPDALSAIRSKLAADRASMPLFDTGKSCRAIESAYAQMAERYARGEGPAGFTVVAADG